MNVGALQSPALKSGQILSVPAQEKKMKTVKSAVKTRLASVSLLVLVSLLAPLYLVAQQKQPFPPVPGVPDIINPDENDVQHQGHFLTFLGSFIAEDAASSTAYYKAIDPYSTKTTFPDWLKNAGFISDVHQWHSHGTQVIVTGQPTGPGAYGDNIINTDSHVIVLNAADLGFVRNQFIRCKPSCTAPNPTIYTYLENYPVAPFAKGGSNFGTGDPTITSSAYPFQSEAAASIKSALTRPLGVLGGDGKTPCPPGDPTCIERIADVAFEWAAPALNPTSSNRFGQLYAYIFVHGAPGVNGSPDGITETVYFPDSFTGKKILDFKTGQIISINGGVHGDKFAPNLDGVGFKQHPGVCLVCHGGKPTNLTSTGAYPRQGNIDGFRLLPLDNRNLLFTSDSGPEATSRVNQETQTKEYNIAVLQTVPAYLENDGTGAVRVPHLREVITGWYAAFDGDQSFGRSTQNSNFLPKGWRDATHGGTAAQGASNLYINVVGPSCRSCHFNRELSLDFGTYANFHQESDLQQLSLLGECKQGNDADPNAKFMPLAHLTFQRFWQTQSSTQTLGDGTPLSHVVDELAADFGYGSVAGYCATNP
jgi:hypothetical protein